MMRPSHHGGAAAAPRQEAPAPDAPGRGSALVVALSLVVLLVVARLALRVVVAAGLVRLFLLRLDRDILRAGALLHLFRPRSGVLAGCLVALRLRGLLLLGS